MQTTMNLLLLGAASLPIGYMAFGFISLLVPPKCVLDACLPAKILHVFAQIEEAFFCWRALTAAL